MKWVLYKGDSDFSNCEACQSTETQVKKEIEKGFFFYPFFNQFTKD